MMMSYTKRALVVLALSTLMVFSSADARQFRNLKRIATPQNEQADLPPGAVLSKQIKPVPRQVVERRVQQLVEKWNSSEMPKTLGPEFFDRSRLLDAMDNKVPKDSKLRLLAVQGSQTLQQYRLPAEGDRREQEISIVSATVRTQLEFNRADGLVRLPGTNEFFLKVVRTKK